jgi:hypothetical protein
MVINGANGADNKHQPLYFNKNIFKMSTTQKRTHLHAWRCQLLLLESAFGFAQDVNYSRRHLCACLEMSTTTSWRVHSCSKMSTSFKSAFAYTPRCQLFLEHICKGTKISTSLERNCIRDMQEACKAYALTNNQCLCMLVPLYKLSLYINGMPVCDIVWVQVCKIHTFTNSTSI